jgi:DNA polymerase III subunit gamma/tau
MAAGLPMRALTRMWQMLLKALEEVAQAPNAMMAAEMAIIRLTHVADLPAPEDLVRRLQSAPPPAPGPAPRGGGGETPGPRASAMAPVRSGGAQPAPATAPVTQASFDAVVALIRENRDMALLVEVETQLRLARYSPGRIEFEPTPDARPDLAARLAQRLQSWTGHRWAVTVVNEGGGATIAEQQQKRQLAAEDEARTHPLVAAVLAAFPDARITDIRTPETAPVAAAAESALAEVEDEWDPFEQD